MYLNKDTGLHLSEMLSDQIYLLEIRLARKQRNVEKGLMSEVLLNDAKAEMARLIAMREEVKACTIQKVDVGKTYRYTYEVPNPDGSLTTVEYTVVEVLERRYHLRYSNGALNQASLGSLFNLGAIEVTENPTDHRIAIDLEIS